VIAGTGQAGFSGDGGPAVSARLAGPSGVAFDLQGNLYIADSGNCRIRRITRDGTIRSLAGSNCPMSPGDPLPPVLFPTELAVDAAGDAYFVDLNSTVNRVTASGAVEVVAGDGQRRFSGDGGPARLASLKLLGTSGLAFDPAGNLLIGDTQNNRVRMVLAAPPAVSPIPESLSFRVQSGGAPSPAQTFIMSASVQGLAFMASASTADGGAWLTATPSEGATPRRMEVTVDALDLAPGNYKGTIAIQTPNGAPPARILNVSLVVEPGVPPHLDLDKKSLPFTFPARSTARSQAFLVRNDGGSRLNFNVASMTDSGVALLRAAHSS
jgi:sugar lactone lactonase YvrE